MKPPPFLLGATLLFWGWQSGLLVVGAAMAVGLESARFVKARWDLTDEDLSRVWTFCSLLGLGALVYAFTANEGPSSFGNFFQDPNPATQTGAGAATSRTSAAFFRWLPMVFFPFIAAQGFSTREMIPLSVFSLILRRRRKKAQRLGQPAPPERQVAIGHPYLAVCLLAASIHAPTETRYNTFFWGLCALLAWALWSQRSRRFAVAVWVGALLVALALGFAGQFGVGQGLGVLQNLNPQWLTLFLRRGLDAEQSRTALGRIGALKLSGQIVVRLETQAGAPPPQYLREASYRVYRSEVWHASSGKNEFEGVLETPPNSAIWPLLPAKTNTTAVRIASYLEDWKEGARAGLLPLPRTSGCLEKLNAFSVQRNPAGAVLATGPGLVLFDALYGPGATIDAPADTSDDLHIPPREAPGLAQVVSDLQLKSDDLQQALRQLGAFFGDKFTYSTWQGRGKPANTNETPLSRFLLSTRKGHCEYFGTATVLLLRQAGIPARYAVGYAVHEGAGRKYVVRQRDAHAWCLVWDQQHQQWLDFDTTPASWMEAEANRARLRQWLSDAWSRIRYEFAKVWWGQTNVRPYLLWSLAPVLALLLYQILFRRGRRRRVGRTSRSESGLAWPGLDSEFYLLERELAGRGVPRAPSEPLPDWLARVPIVGTDAEELKATLRELLRLHYRYRFDPVGLQEVDRAGLRGQVHSCLERLNRPAAS